MQWIFAILVCTTLGCSKKPVTTNTQPNNETPNGKSDGPANRADHGIDARPANPTCLAPDRPPSLTAVDFDQLFGGLRFESPVWMEQAPGGDDWFVVQQTGVIERFENSSGTSTSSTFLDMSDVTLFEDEQGMLGLAFHPQWPNSPKAYVSYNGVSGGATFTVVSEISSTDGGQTLDRSTEEFVFTLEQPFANHNGGQISFGPDGFLYIALGDGGAADDPFKNGQDTSTLLATILRLDVDGTSGQNNYAIPADNPFANGGGRPEIYAYGLRNPWRFSFDQETGALWVGDVGQDEVEEINIVELGGNYGWSDKEASNCFDRNPCAEGPWIDPVLEYQQGQNDRSITGGYVYRGTKVPSLVGKYVFADFVSGKMWAAVEDPDTGELERQLLAETGINISSFAQGNDGEMYFLDYFNGRIFGLVNAGPAQNSNFPQTLSATGCFDPNEPTTPVDALVPYTINAPFWSDGAEKERWLAIPDGKQITIGSDGDWDFPIGSVLVKSFTVGAKLVETRLLVRHNDGDWAGYSYEWRADLSDADLVVGGKVADLGSQQWTFPSSGDCLGCHTTPAGRTLGLETAQLNGDHTYASTNRISNQLATLDHIGLFAQSPGPAASLAALADPLGDAPVQDRVEAYLHTNCAQCHRSDANLRVDFDLRAGVPWADRGVCNTDPTNSDLGVSGAKLLVPGSSASSLMHLRMTRRDASGMPPLGSAVVDTVGADLIAQWIDGLSTCP